MWIVIAVLGILCLAFLFPAPPDTRELEETYERESR